MTLFVICSLSADLPSSVTLLQIQILVAESIDFEIWGNMIFSLKMFVQVQGQLQIPDYKTNHIILLFNIHTRKMGPYLIVLMFQITPFQKLLQYEKDNFHKNFNFIVIR